MPLGMTRGFDDFYGLAAKRYEDVKALREADKPTIPTTLETEKQTNVFLRAGSAEKFAELRRLKDRV